MINVNTYEDESYMFNVLMAWIDHANQSPHDIPRGLDIKNFLKTVPEAPSPIKGYAAKVQEMLAAQQAYFACAKYGVGNRKELLATSKELEAEVANLTREIINPSPAKPTQVNLFQNGA